MVLSSPIFLGFFLPIVLITYLITPRYLRTYSLLAFSLLFYAWGEPKAVFVLIGLMSVNHLLGLLLMQDLKGFRGLVLSVGVFVDLAALFGYKYLGFVGDNLASMGVKVGLPEIALPMGISFYVFQLISYLVDVYRQATVAQRNPFYFMLYVSFFPQLIAGPIVRYTTIATEITDRTVRWENVAEGLKRFVVGLAKKVLIADNMAIVADSVFSCDATTIPCAYCWIGAIAYALQIYYDFSGYSDMAIGLGRAFNFHFLENFNHPYSASSIQDFWRRWHMSLSTWFRDYLYIPLGGNRKGLARTYLNMFLVFALCGAWHGASWGFVVWGVYHGLGIVVERLLVMKICRRIPPLLAHAYTLLFVLVGWVIFRSETLSFAGAFLHTMFAGAAGLSNGAFPAILKFASISNIGVLIVGVFISCRPASNLGIRIPANVQYVFCGVLAIGSIICAMTSGYSPFIYFRF